MALLLQAILIESNLSDVLGEIRDQPEIGENFSPGQQSYSEQIEQIREYIEDAGEY